MTKLSPMVSVIIPVYNSAMTLDDCILRVAKQTYQNWEIVIVDSNSTDDTRGIALKWSAHLGEEKCKYCNTRIRSRTKARNLGVKLARGERIFLLDSDNFLPEEFLKECVKKTSTDNFDGLRTRVKEVWKDKSYIAKCWYFLIYCEENGELKQRPYPNFFKRDVWLTLGGQNEKLEFGEDLEFTLRFEQAGYYAPVLEKPFVMHNMPFSLKSILFKTISSKTSSFKYPKKIVHKPRTISSPEGQSIWFRRILFMLKNPESTLGMTLLTLMVVIGIVFHKISY
jgi:glycosyltransferase involved in cell wall biosynthesis